MEPPFLPGGQEKSESGPTAFQVGGGSRYGRPFPGPARIQGYQPIRAAIAVAYPDLVPEMDRVHETQGVAVIVVHRRQVFLFMLQPGFAFIGRMQESMLP